MSRALSFRVAARALSDLRIRRLARLLHLSHPEALGRLLFVWHAVYEHHAESLDAETIDTVAEVDGFAAAMGTVGLAEEQPDGLWRICGASDQLTWQAGQRAKAAKGGKRKAQNRMVAGAVAGAVAPALAHALPSDQIPDQDLGDRSQKGCGEVGEGEAEEPLPVGVDEALCALSAARTRLAIELGQGAPRLAFGARLELLEMLERERPSQDELRAAIAALEQRARDRRRVELAGVDDLALAVLTVRRGPRAAPDLRVVRDLDGGGEQEAANS